MSVAPRNLRLIQPDFFDGQHPAAAGPVRKENNRPCEGLFAGSSLIKGPDPLAAARRGSDCFFRQPLLLVTACFPVIAFGLRFGLCHANRQHWPLLPVCFYRHIRYSRITCIDTFVRVAMDFGYAAVEQLLVRAVPLVGLRLKNWQPVNCLADF